MSFTRITDPKGATNALELIRQGLADLEAEAFFLVPDDDTAVGPPSSGTYELHELWVDAVRGVWVCVTAGSPGTWRQLYPGVDTSFPSSPPTGYEVIRDDLARRRYRYDGSRWHEVGVYRHLQTSSAQVWTINHGRGAKPTSVTIWIDGYKSEGTTRHIDNNITEITFRGAEQGEAALAFS